MNKKILIIVLIVALSILGYGIYTRIKLYTCKGLEEDINRAKNLNQDVSYRNITDDEAKEELDRDKTIILLDVRTKEEYEEKHILDSILIPVDELELKASSKLKDKNQKIFIYCRSGNRSVTAANILIKLGYTQIYNLGGIIDWKYETE